MAPKRIKVRAPRGYIGLHRDKFRAEVTIDGDRKRRAFDTEEEAQQWLLDLCRRVRSGIPLSASEVTVSQLVDDTLSSKRTKGLKPTTLQAYDYAAGFIKDKLGDTKVQQLSAHQINQFLNHLATKAVSRRHKKGEEPTAGLSAKYRKNILAFLNVCLEHAIRSDIIDRNPAIRVERPKWEREPPKAWTLEQVELFKTAIQGDRLEAMWWVLLSTGMRVGEIAALKWEDVDLVSGNVSINKSLIRLRTGIVIGPPKSRSSVRTVSLPLPVVEKLKEWRAKQREERVKTANRWVDEGWVFTTFKGNLQGDHRVGRHLEPNWILKKLGGILRDHNIPYIPVHGVRHTFITQMLRNNSPVRDVQEVAGHSSPAITNAVYNQSIAGSAPRVGVKAGEVFFPPVSPNPTTNGEDFPQISPDEEDEAV